ncbi:MAG: hypothetical protein HYT70_00605 [Candidatus Aenigmarchaeota archaeon]|nr:hypothetical protein [Candidatus Aenigmarchaeota archaeon]
MKKGVFGKVLTMIITLITAAIALVLIWSILEKITGVSIGLLGAAMNRFACENIVPRVPGDEAGRVAIGAGAGGVLFGGIGCGIGFLAGGVGLPVGCALGAGLGALAGGFGGYKVNEACQ